MKRAKLTPTLVPSPPGWPTEKQWKKIEKKIAKTLPTKDLPKNATSVDRVKYDLCAHFVIFRQEKGMTQRELAKLIGVTESRVSEILHYHIGRFTIDKLLSLLTKLKPQLKVKVS